MEDTEKLDPENVVYQGRILVSALTLIPACIWQIQQKNLTPISRSAQTLLTKWINGVLKRAGLLKNGIFISKSEFKKKGFLGSGGIGRFRDTLWASTDSKDVARLTAERRSELAGKQRNLVFSRLSKK